MEVPKETSS